MLPCGCQRVRAPLVTPLRHWPLRTPDSAMLSRPVKTEVQTLIQSAVNELVGFDCLRPTIPSVPIICLHVHVSRPSAPWSSELQPACQCVVQCCAIVRTSGAGAYCTRVLRTSRYSDKGPPVHGCVARCRASTSEHRWRRDSHGGGVMPVPVCQSSESLSSQTLSR